MAELHICITTSASCTKGNPLIVTLLPAVIGAMLGFASALFLRRSERAWQRSRDNFVREMQIVQPLDDALVETQRRIIGHEVPERESRWRAAHQQWENGWVRLTPHLTDDELDDRYKAVGTILLELADREDDDDFKSGTAVQIAMRAIGSARLALAYWIRGEPLPAASFPSSEETIVLLGQGDPSPLSPNAPLRRWLDDHPQPAWRTKRKSGRSRLRRGED